MGFLSNLKRKISVADVLAANRPRGDARRIADELQLKSADRVMDWARPCPSPENEYATGRMSPFERLLKYFDKLFERAERHLHAESDETAFALMQFAINKLWYQRFYKQNIQFSGKEQEAMDFQLWMLAGKYYRFKSLNEQEKARTVWVRLSALVPRIEYSLYQPETAAT